MQSTSSRIQWTGYLWQTCVALLLLAALLAACVYAPTEASMGHAQRIIYIHVPVAWLGLLGFLLMAGSGVCYLARRDLRWDHWFQAAGEAGWLCTSLTLVTGSLWAHQAWGTWWEWDPRLTTAFILWAIYSGILLVRSGLDDPHRRARFGAVLAILGSLDIPLVVMATRWFRGMHPVAPEMSPEMRIALLLGAVAMTALVAWLVVQRSHQVGLEQLACRLQRQMDADG